MLFNSIKIKIFTSLRRIISFSFLQVLYVKKAFPRLIVSSKGNRCANSEEQYPCNIRKIITQKCILYEFFSTASESFLFGQFFTERKKSFTFNAVHFTPSRPGIMNSVVKLTFLHSINNDWIRYFSI